MNSTVLKQYDINFRGNGFKSAMVQQRQQALRSKMYVYWAITILRASFQYIFKALNCLPGVQ